MQEEDLLKLIAEAKSHGGGLILNIEDKPQAVVLSVDAYESLKAGQSVAGLPVTDAGEQATEQQKTVLVTGGAGYIGAHVVRGLLDAGFAVVVLDNFSTGKREYVPPTVACIEGDVRNSELLNMLFRHYHIDAVVHLAALLEVAESVERPAEYFDVNTQGTACLLKAMHAAGVTQLVFSSTAAVYGEARGVSIAEVSKTNPSNPYGTSKLLAEQTILYSAEYTGLSACVLRFFNVAGSHPEWNIHDTHTASHLVPIVLEVARGERASLVINGGDWETFDGSCVRDYVHVHDIARAHVAAVLHTLASGVSGLNVYNVGTGHGVSVREVVQTAAEVTGRMIPMEIGPRRNGDVASLVADVSKIKQELGFTAQNSLEDIIRSAWQGSAQVPRSK